MSKYEIKEAIDNFIFGIYNVLASIVYPFSKDKRLAAKNIRFKDIHKGEKCYILGTGPSLKTVNLDFLKDEISIGVNYLYRSDKIDQINPKYYCLIDEHFHQKDIENTKEVLKKLPESTFFVRTKAYDGFINAGITNETIYYHPCKLFQHGDFIRVDMTRPMTAPYNVLLGCIQIAMYMGFKEIYLLGCDYSSFASLKKEHFYEDKDHPEKRNMSLGYEIKYYALCTYHHYALEKYAQQNGIHIYNLTDNSLLDAYERIAFAEHIKSISGK